jgi:hypothetical protein
MKAIRPDMASYSSASEAKSTVTWRRVAFDFPQLEDGRR